MDVRVTLSGTDRAFQHLDTDTLLAAVDTAIVRPGAQRIRLDSRNLQLPDGLTLHSIDPDFVTLVAHANGGPSGCRAATDDRTAARRGLAQVDQSEAGDGAARRQEE